MNPPRKLTRRNYNWVPDVDDDNDYIWKHGAWEIDNRDEEIDEDALEEYEEKRRERIARQNEY